MGQRVIKIICLLCSMILIIYAAEESKPKQKRGAIERQDLLYGGWRPILPGNRYFFGSNFFRGNEGYGSSQDFLRIPTNQAELVEAGGFQFQQHHENKDHSHGSESSDFPQQSNSAPDPGITLNDQISILKISHPTPHPKDDSEKNIFTYYPPPTTASPFPLPKSKAKPIYSETNKKPFGLDYLDHFPKIEVYRGGSESNYHGSEEVAFQDSPSSKVSENVQVQAIPIQGVPIRIPQNIIAHSNIEQDLKLEDRVRVIKIPVVPVQQEGSQSYDSGEQKEINQERPFFGFPNIGKINKNNENQKIFLAHENFPQQTEESIQNEKRPESGHQFRFPQNDEIRHILSDTFLKPEQEFSQIPKRPNFPPPNYSQENRRPKQYNILEQESSLEELGYSRPAHIEEIQLPNGLKEIHTYHFPSPNFEPSKEESAEINQNEGQHSSEVKPPNHNLPQASYNEDIRFFHQTSDMSKHPHLQHHEENKFLSSNFENEKPVLTAPGHPKETPSFHLLHKPNDFDSQQVSQEQGYKNSFYQNEHEPHKQEEKNEYAMQILHQPPKDRPTNIVTFPMAPENPPKHQDYPPEKGTQFNYPVYERDQENKNIYPNKQAQDTKNIPGYSFHYNNNNLQVEDNNYDPKDPRLPPGFNFQTDEYSLPNYRPKEYTIEIITESDEKPKEEEQQQQEQQQYSHQGQQQYPHQEQQQYSHQGQQQYPHQEQQQYSHQGQQQYPHQEQQQYSHQGQQQYPHQEQQHSQQEQQYSHQEQQQYPHQEQQQYSQQEQQYSQQQNINHPYQTGNGEGTPQNAVVPVILAEITRRPSHTNVPKDQHQFPIGDHKQHQFQSSNHQQHNFQSNDHQHQFDHQTSSESQRPYGNSDGNREFGVFNHIQSQQQIDNNQLNQPDQEYNQPEQQYSQPEQEQQQYNSQNQEQYNQPEQTPLINIPAQIIFPSVFPEKYPSQEDTYKFNNHEGGGFDRPPPNNPEGYRSPIKIELDKPEDTNKPYGADSPHAEEYRPKFPEYNHDHQEQSSYQSQQNNQDYSAPAEQPKDNYQNTQDVYNIPVVIQPVYPVVLPESQNNNKEQQPPQYDPPQESQYHNPILRPVNEGQDYKNSFKSEKDIYYKPIQPPFTSPSSIATPLPPTHQTFTTTTETPKYVTKIPNLTKNRGDQLFVSGSRNSHKPSPEKSTEMKVLASHSTKPPLSKEILKTLGLDKNTKSNLYHAYYAPANHDPPPGYVRLSLKEFKELFKNADIHYVSSDSQSTFSRENATQKTSPFKNFKPVMDDYGKYTTARKVPTVAPTKSTNKSEDEEIITIDLKPGQTIDDALTELGTIKVGGVTLDAAKLQKGEYGPIEIVEVIEEQANTTKQTKKPAIIPRSRSRSKSYSNRKNYRNYPVRYGGSTVSQASTNREVTVPKPEISTKVPSTTIKPTPRPVKRITNGKYHYKSYTQNQRTLTTTPKSTSTTTTTTESSETPEPRYGNRIRPVRVKG